MEALLDYLGDREALLILDNCEHLVDECAHMVRTLLRSAEGLRVLATSRQSLGIEGEQVFGVPPLTVPDGEVAHEIPDALLRYESVSLFVDRAQSILPTFALDQATVEHVARLCRDLEGLPLAIELAAVRLRSLSVADIVAGLDRDADALDRGRRAAAERGLSVEFVEQPAASWHGTADRALCVGSSHAFGGTRRMLARLAELVPRGQVLIGDGCWPGTPTPAAHAIFGDDVLSLADLATACRDTGWQVLHLDTASQREWDDFESRHRAGQREWLLANPDDPRAAEVRERHAAREHEYLTAYRGVLGFAYLVLGRRA